MNHLSSSSLCGAETLVDLSLSHAQTRGDQPFLVWLGNGRDESHSYTFSSLDRQARCLAVQLTDELRTRGKAHDGRPVEPAALIVLQHGPEFAVAFFGCLYAGIAAVPVFPPKRNEGGERLLLVLENSGASIVVTNASTIDLLKGLGLDSRVTLLPVEELDDTAGNRWVRPAINADSVAFIQYTSGSTGTPKGVVVTHGNVLSNERMIADAFQSGESPTVIGWLPMFHDTGLVGNLLHPFSLGARTILMSPMTFMVKPIRWLEAITRYRATISGGPNFGYEYCLGKISAEQRRSLDLSSWRVAFNGAEPVRASTLTRFSEEFADAGFDRNAFLPCYGMAECSLLVTGTKRSGYPTILPVDRDELARGKVLIVVDDPPRLAESQPADLRSASSDLVSSGSPPSGCETKIVDATGEELSEGQIGEIWISGPNVAQGYKDDAELSARTFGARLRGDASGRVFLRSGDLGFIHRGELFVTGRKKDVIIIAGRNLYPQDIEVSALGALPALAEGTAAAFSIERGNEERVVLVVSVSKRVSHSLVMSAVARVVTASVTRNHGIELEDLLIVASRLPTTSSNKIRRSSCRQQYLDGGFPDTRFSTKNDRLIATESPNRFETA